MNNEFRTKGIKMKKTQTGILLILLVTLSACSSFVPTTDEYNEYICADVNLIYGEADEQSRKRLKTDTSHGYYETSDEAGTAWYSILFREIKETDKAEFIGVSIQRVSMMPGGPAAELFVLQNPERLVDVKTAYTIESIAVFEAPPELDRGGTSNQRAFAQVADRGDAEQLADLLNGAQRYTKAELQENVSPTGLTLRVVFRENGNIVWCSSIYRLGDRYLLAQRELNLEASDFFAGTEQSFYSIDNPQVLEAIENAICGAEKQRSE